MNELLEELPEYQIFTILRQGEKDPIGPYSQNQIVALLNQGKIRPVDLVYYDGIGEWRPLSEVFDLHQTIANFVDEGQDQEIVSDVFGALSEMLAESEPIYYIAVQEWPSLKLRKPDSVALTEAAVYVIHHRKGTLEVEPYPWDKIFSVTGRVRVGENDGTLAILLQNATRIEVERVPRPQLARAEKIAAEILGAKAT